MQIKNSFWSMAGGAIPAFFALICTPFMISALGLNLFAIISLVMSVTIFFYVYDLGMSRTLTYLISRSTRGNQYESADLIGSALISTFFLGLLITLILYCLTPFFLENWMRIDKNLLREATLAFETSVLGIIPGLLSNIFKGVLEGRSQFKESNLCKMFSGAGIFIAPIIAILFLGNNLFYISAAIVFSRYLSLIVYVYFSISISTIFDFKLRRSCLNSIWSYGVWAALSGLISTAFIYGDRFIVAGYLDPEGLSTYIASQDVLNRYLLIPWSMATVLMPAFSSNSIVKTKLIELYRLQQKRVGIMSFFILLLVLVTAIWLAEFVKIPNLPENAIYVVAIQIAGIFFGSLSQLPFIYLYGKGVPRLITNIFLVELLVYIFMGPFVFRNFGVIGASFVWSGRMVMEYLLLSHFAKRLITE